LFEPTPEEIRMLGEEKPKKKWLKISSFSVTATNRIQSHRWPPLIKNSNILVGERAINCEPLLLLLI